MTGVSILRVTPATSHSRPLYPRPRSGHSRTFEREYTKEGSASSSCCSPSRAIPSEPCMDVKVPHSCTTSPDEPPAFNAAAKTIPSSMFASRGKSCPAGRAGREGVSAELPAAGEVLRDLEEVSLRIEEETEAAAVQSVRVAIRAGNFLVERDHDGRL